MMIKWDVTIPQLSGQATRRGYVYLPESYERLPNRRYPVLYMFDGHNVFLDEDATYGKSWGMAQYMEKTAKDLIIVAIECNHEGNRRLSEYSPVDFEYGPVGKISGQGKVYMDWMVETLKPYIDNTYRTIADREHTFIAGSSMGGLMALYAVTCYNHVYSKAACLSPSLWAAPAAIMDILSAGQIGEQTCIYMDYGTLELHNHEGTLDAIVNASRILLYKNAAVTSRMVPGGRHCEASWEKQVPVFMQCLGI